MCFFGSLCLRGIFSIVILLRQPLPKAGWLVNKRNSQEFTLFPNFTFKYNILAGNTFGNLLKLTTFGESHGMAMGGILDGFPAGVAVDQSMIQKDLARRRPGQSDLVSPRKEDDLVEILSGVFDGVSLGTPIGFIIRNKDHRSKDYSHIKDTFRPSHADYTFEQKFGRRDYRGGGRSSARETVCRVAGGAFAKILLHNFDIKVHAFVHSIGKVSMAKSFADVNLEDAEKSPVRCPDPEHFRSHGGTDQRNGKRGR